jgi:hypothetical protein
LEKKKKKKKFELEYQHGALRKTLIWPEGFSM